MVAQLTVGAIGAPVDGHGLEPANVAQNISFTAGASPAIEAGTVGTVQIGRDGIAPGRIGTHDGVGDNAVTYTGLSSLLIGIIDGFFIKWDGITYTSDPALFTDAVDTVEELAAIVREVDGPTGAFATKDFNGNLQITTPFLTTINDIALTSSTGLPQRNTTVDITGVTDAEADNVDSFTLTINGVALDTSAIDFGTITNRAQLAAALAALPGINVTESSANGGTITITAETQGPKTFTGLSLADLTPNPAAASFGAADLAALDALVAAAESFELKLNGTELDLGLDFGAIDTAAQLVAALELAPGIAAQLVGSTFTIVSDALGPGNAFSELELIDNEGSPPAFAMVTITDVNDFAADVAAFTLSIDGVPVDVSVVDFAAAVDGVSLAAELDKIAGIDVAYSAASGGTLNITASAIGPAVFSNVTLTRPNTLVGDPILDDILTGFANGTWIIGLGGNDRLTGQGGDDRLDGGAGNDRLIGGAGDEILGGAGDDLIILDGAPASLSGGDGHDTVRIMSSMLLPDAPDIELYEVANHGGITADFSAASAGVVVRTTTSFAPGVIGSAHGDTITGYDGNDAFDGGGGDDSFTGGAADDDLTGGDGTDTAVFTGARAQYRVELLGNGDIRIFDLRGGAPDGMDTVREIERFAFSDQTITAATILNDPPTGAVSIAGNVVEDQTLTADASALDDQDGLGILHYQWQRDSGSGFVNVGTGQPSYALTDDDVAATVRVIVSYTDPNGASEQVTSVITDAVANINDAPVINAHGSGTSLLLPENETAVTKVTALDPDGPALGYSIIGGADAALFRIDAASGALSFVTAPDFEAAADAGRDNSYLVDVRASDGSLFDDQSITVTVVNADDRRTGTSGDDHFDARAGSERIDAGGGNDTVAFAFRLVEATVTYSGNQVIVHSGSGHTVLTGFETYVFADGSVHNNDANRLVDDLFYYSHNHDVWNAHVDADQHYEQNGWREWRDPSAFFSTSFYLALNPEVSSAGLSPLDHFHQTGWLEGRAPSMAFDATGYLRANPDVAGIDPLAHFLTFGAQEGREPVALTAFIGANGFDYVYYLQHNPDVAAAHVDPFAHYQAHGWREGRDPNALFDSAGYLATYTDVAAANVNPLDHYHQHGWREGRDPSVGFDTSAYLAAYPDLAAAGVDPLKHFLQFGAAEGRAAFADGVWG